jgi:hypothetical protein
MYRFLICTAIAGIFAVPAFGQGVDPLLGTWKLNYEKSTATFPIPKELSLTYSMEGDHIIGKGGTSTYTMIFDGQPHPTIGNQNSDSAAYTRVGNTINMVSFKNGKVVDVAQLSNVTNKTYTVTAEGITANGQSYRFTYVWNRQ